MVDLDKLEGMVDKYAAENRTEDAVKVLFELITTYAKQKNFPKAEALRDRLFEVDSSALMEIVKAADIIEDEKSKAVDQDHMSVWPDLYSTLNADDSNTLHFAMQEKEFESNQVVFNQGDEDANLYFIDQGQLKMVYSQGGYEYLIKEIGPGELAGEDTFFANTAFSTHSLIALTRGKLHSLEKDIALSWEKESSGILPRLKDYCGKFQSVQDLLEKKGYDRRNHKRVGITGKGITQFLDSAGTPSGKPVKVSLADVSAGGVSFFLRFSQQETARLLLGRGLFIKFAVTVGEKKKDVTKKGLVVGVRNHGFGDNSVHIKFNSLLPEKLIDVLERIQARSAGAPKPDPA